MTFEKNAEKENKATRTFQFLGTGAGDFYQTGVTYDDNALYAKSVEMRGRNIRRPASCLISPDLLIDFHSDDTLRLCNIPLQSINHLLITHGHFDHFNPRAILDFASTLPHTLNIYGNEMVKNSIEFACKNKWDENARCLVKRNESPKFNVTNISHGESFMIDDVKITPIRANHMVEMQYMLINQDAMNFIFEYDGKTIFYGIDSSYILPETFEILSGFRFDACILDGTFGDMEIDPFRSGHLNFKMLLETVEQLRQAGSIRDKTQIIASHISMTTVEPHDLIEAQAASKGIILAYDGKIMS